MPIHEYQCPNGHITEELFKTFKEAEGVLTIQCPHCKTYSSRIISTPGGLMFYGNPEGYHKPSPTKRHSTKVVSEKTGNKGAIG